MPSCEGPRLYGIQPVTCFCTVDHKGNPCRYYPHLCLMAQPLSCCLPAFLGRAVPLEHGYSINLYMGPGSRGHALSSPCPRLRAASGSLPVFCFVFCHRGNRRGCITPTCPLAQPLPYRCPHRFPWFLVMINLYKKWGFPRSRACVHVLCAKGLTVRDPSTALYADP